MNVKSLIWNKFTLMLMLIALGAGGYVYWGSSQKHKPRFKSGKPAIAAPNRLQQQFTVNKSDAAWVTDITYVRTYEGGLYLAVVIDLYSRAVVGWSMKPNMPTEIVLDALLMAVWRRKPELPVIIHSDQGSQFGSDDFVRWCKDNKLIPSMSRRGNCYDNAVAESFFSSLKKERIRRKIYSTREEAKSEIFDYIEVFYNRIRRHAKIGNQVSADFANRFYASRQHSAT